MAKVKDLNWTAEVELTRSQVVSLGLLAGFITNIEQDYKKQFPSGMKGVNWTSVREAFHEFKRAYSKDQEVYKSLTDLVRSVNKSEHQ